MQNFRYPVSKTKKMNEGEGFCVTLCPPCLWYLSGVEPKKIWEGKIPYLHKSYNTPLLPQKICMGIILYLFHVPGEIANNDYAKFWGGG